MKAKQVVALMMATTLAVTGNGITTLAGQTDLAVESTEMEAVQEEEEVKEAAVNYTIDSETVYLTEGQSQELKVYAGGNEVSGVTWVPMKAANGEENETDEIEVDGNSAVTLTSGSKAYVENEYHVYPQVEGKNVKDANGNDLYYTVVYLGAVELTAPGTTEYKVGDTVAFEVKSEYADASEELQNLVKKHAKVDYAVEENGSASTVLEIKNGVLSYADGQSASNLTAGTEYTIKATSGNTDESTLIYVSPTKKQCVSKVAVGENEVTLVQGGTETVKLSVEGSNGNAAFNTAVDIVSSDDDGVLDTTTAPSLDADGNLKITAGSTKTGTATITITSKANKNAKATVTVTVVEAEPYELKANQDSFVIDGSDTSNNSMAIADVISNYATETAGVTAEYKVVVSNVHGADGKSVTDKTKASEIIKYDETNGLVAGETEGYATVTITGTIKISDTVGYNDTVTYTVYNTTKPTAVNFVDTDDKGQETWADSTALSGSYAVGENFNLKAYGVKATVTAGSEVGKEDKATFSGVRWTSSNEEVATVKDGVVTIVGAGENVTITAASEVDSSVTATWSVTAKDLNTASITAKDSSDTEIGSESGAFSVVGGSDAVTLELDKDYSDVADYNWEITDGAAYAAVAANEDGTANFTPKKVEKGPYTVEVAVTLTSKNNSKIKATKTITAYVTSTEVVAPDSIVINDGELTGTTAVSTGDTMDLTATVLAADGETKASVQDVTWVSDDDTVISVDANGKLTALKATEDAVAVTATSKVDDTVTAEVKFVVADVPAETLTVDSEEAFSLEAGAAKEVTVAVKNADGTKDATNQEVTVTSDNEAVATVSAVKDGKFTVNAVAEGAANITVTSKENEKATKTIAVTVTAKAVTPVDPTPVDPTPVDPTPVDPTPVDPTPVDPTPAPGNTDTVEAAEIKVDQSAVAFDTIGATVKVNAVVTPDNAANKTVTWTTSDANVATVAADGTITAVGNGTATVTAATANGKTATVTVTVSQKTEKVSITLNGQNVSGTLKARKGAKYQLKAVVTPTNADAKNAAVKWTTSNKKVATVSANGKVTVKKAGKTVTITATTADGKKVSVKLKTQKSAVKATKLTIKGNNTMKVKGTQKLKVTVAPATVDNSKVTWSSSNTKIATVNKNGKVTAKKKGTVTITVKAADGSGKKATFKIKVK